MCQRCRSLGNIPSKKKEDGRKLENKKKKLARKYSEICPDPEVTAGELLDAMQTKSIENGRKIGQDDDDNSSGQQPSH